MKKKKKNAFANVSCIDDISDRDWMMPRYGVCTKSDRFYPYNESNIQNTARK